jgi:hypothetical protein
MRSTQSQIANIVGQLLQKLSMNGWGTFLRNWKKLQCDVGRIGYVSRASRNLLWIKVSVATIATVRKVTSRCQLVDILKRNLQTELTVDSDDFDNYQVQYDTDVTFSLKDLKVLSQSLFNNA